LKVFFEKDRVNFIRLDLGRMLWSIHFLLPWILNYFQPLSAEYLNEYVLKPTPDNTKVTELYYHNPIFGDSGLLVDLELPDEGMA